MNRNNYCLHVLRRCFFSRSCLFILSAIAASVVANYLLADFILKSYPPSAICSCKGDEYSEIFSDLALAVDDLKALKTVMEDEIALKEKYLEELNSKISTFHDEIFQLRHKKTAEESKVEELHHSIQLQEAKLKTLEANYTPKILPPFKVYVDASSSNQESVALKKEASKACDMLHCFDFSRCRLFSPLRVFMYHSVPENVGLYDTDGAYQDSCLFVYYQTEHASTPSSKDLTHLNDASELNHVVLVNGDLSDSQRLDLAATVIVGAVSFPSSRPFAKEFDVVLPFASKCFTGDLPQLLPVLRQMLFTFVDITDSKADEMTRKAVSHVKSLKSTTSDVFQLISTSVANIDHDNCRSGEFVARLANSFKSTFSVLPFEPSQQFLFNVLLSEVIYSGSIPVILHSGDIPLPLDEVINWNQVAVLLPAHRASELYYLLRSFSVATVVSYKIAGRAIFEQYFSSKTAVLAGVFATFTRRLQLPPPALQDFVAESSYPTRFAPTIQMQPAPFAEDGVEIALDDYLGPVELPRPSSIFTSNFTYSSSVCGRLQDGQSGQFLFMAPNSPFSQLPFVHDVAVKSYSSVSMDFRPVGQGLGGSGRELGLALGGNQPAEQFTIVLLTRGGDRLTILIDIISRFKHLPYLNKVIVVWNSPESPPGDSVKWPELVVPIFVAKMPNNSLNNRFLPLSEIETDAVLSLDDDTFLRPDEIVFAFRVWRENREKIVGFPSRGHGWNTTSQSWVYYSDYSCEYSLILTGASFIHKYYFYLYSYLMPARIRSTVDRLMNCEDIAMNFLVSHVTRKSPLKVTVRWTFHCPTCQKTLSKEHEHYAERSECIQTFVNVYGYNPLLYSQARADSVLFKTRVPSSHQKCFKFV